MKESLTLGREATRSTSRQRCLHKFFSVREAELRVLLAVPVFVLACYGAASSQTQPAVESISLIAVSCHFMIFAGIAKSLSSLSLRSDEHGGWRSHWRRSVRIFLYNKRVIFMQSSLGDLLNFVVMIVSVLACGLYVIETYMPAIVNEFWWSMVELIVCLLFIIDHFVRLFVAIDPVGYLLSLQGLVDVVTFLPVVVYMICRQLAGIEHQNFYGSSLSSFRLIRLVKLLRILRVLKIVHTAPGDHLRIELFTLIFTVVCMVFSAAGLYHWLENHDDCADIGIKNVFEHPKYQKELSEGGCIYFHRALYWCAIEVLGRPRLVMESEFTVCMLVGLVALSVFVIPSHLAAVLQVLQRTNKYQRMSYHPSSWFSRHLVIVGHKEYAAVNMFLYEFFHHARGDHVVQDVVLLFGGPPSTDMEGLISHPLYAGNVTYLQGTPLQEKDLERACFSRAAGVIVMADKDTDSPAWHDGELVTCIQSMKAYWLKEVVKQFRRQRQVIIGSRAAAKFLRPRIIAQVMLPRTRSYLHALPGWTHHDVVLVCSEYISSMLSMAILAQGMATLLFNLVSHIDTQPKYKTKWYKRYESGATQEMYGAPVDGSLLKCTLVDAARRLAAEGCPLIAVKRDTVDVVDQTEVHLFPGPADFTLQEGDRVYCIAPNAIALADAITKVSRAEASASREASTPDLDVFRQRSNLVEDYEGPLGGDGEGENTETLSREVEDFITGLLAEQNTTFSPKPGNARDLILHNFNQHGHRRRGGSRLGSHRALAQLPRSDLLDKLRERAPAWSDHVVVIGIPYSHQDYFTAEYGALTLFLELIREVEVNESLGKPSGIIVVDHDAEQQLASLCQTDHYLMQMAMQRRLRAVSGDPRHSDTMVHMAMVGTARAIVAVPENVGKAMKRSLFSMEGDSKLGRQKLVKQIVDTNTVLTMQMAQDFANTEDPQFVLPTDSGSLPASGMLRPSSRQCVTLLMQEGTTNLFFGQAHMRHVGVNPTAKDITPLNTSPLFAAGGIFATTCCDRLIAEVFFNKHLLTIISMLFRGDPSHHRLRQLACPPEHVGRKYGEAMLDLISSGQMLIGLLRSPDPTTNETFFEDELCELPGLPDAQLPYVVTNPGSKDIVLQASDMLFSIGMTKDCTCTVSGSFGGATSSKGHRAAMAKGGGSWLSASGSSSEVLTATAAGAGLHSPPPSTPPAAAVAAAANHLLHPLHPPPPHHLASGSHAADKLSEAVSEALHHHDATLITV